MEHIEYDFKSLTRIVRWDVWLSDNKLYLLDNRCIVETVCDAQHGDWKSVIAHNIKPIPKGTQLKVKSVWRNFEGLWVAVDYDGRNYDISPRELKYVKRTE
jgi:hypothetical protein